MKPNNEIKYTSMDIRKVGEKKASIVIFALSLSAFEEVCWLFSVNEMSGVFPSSVFLRRYDGEGVPVFPVCLKQCSNSPKVIKVRIKKSIVKVKILIILFDGSDRARKIYFSPKTAYMPKIRCETNAQTDDPVAYVKSAKTTEHKNLTANDCGEKNINEHKNDDRITALNAPYPPSLYSVRMTERNINSSVMAGITANAIAENKKLYSVSAPMYF